MFVLIVQVVLKREPFICFYCAVCHICQDLIGAQLIEKHETVWNITLVVVLNFYLSSRHTEIVDVDADAAVVAATSSEW